jgi:hypothetical protein
MFSGLLDPHLDPSVLVRAMVPKDPDPHPNPYQNATDPQRCWELNSRTHRETERCSLISDLLPIAPLLVEVPGAAGVDDPLPLAPVALGALLLLVEFLALRLQSGQDIEQVGLLRLGRYKVLKRILQDRPTVF